MIWDTSGFAKLVGLTEGDKMLRTWLNDVDFIDTPIPEPIKNVFQEMIDILELELNISLDDKEWDNIIHKKLSLQIKLKKILDDQR